MCCGEEWLRLGLLPFLFVIFPYSYMLHNGSTYRKVHTPVVSELKRRRERVWDGRYSALQNVRAAKGLREPSHSSQLAEVGKPRRVCPRSCRTKQDTDVWWQLLFLRMVNALKNKERKAPFYSYFYSSCYF